MAQILKLYYNVCSGKCDSNIKFRDLQELLLALGFCLVRFNGDHFIYAKKGVEEIINLQPDKNDSSKAKKYQVKQVRVLIKKYRMEVR